MLYQHTPHYEPLNSYDHFNVQCMAITENFTRYILSYSANTKKFVCQIAHNSDFYLHVPQQISCIHFSCPPYMPHAPPISFPRLDNPKLYLVRSKTKSCGMRYFQANLLHPSTHFIIDHSLKICLSKE
jgi:hypothetical protein